MSIMFLRRVIILLFVFSFTGHIYPVDNQYSSQIGIYDKKIDVNDGGRFSYQDFTEDNFISKFWAAIKKQLAESNVFLVITIFKLFLCLILILIWLFSRKKKKINRLMILICITLAVITFINWLIILVSGLSNSQKLFFLMKDTILKHVGIIISIIITIKTCIISFNDTFFFI